MTEAALYLIPVPLGETPLDEVLPVYNRTIIGGIRHFVVENVRSARRFLKRCDSAMEIDDLTFYPLDRHTPAEVVSTYLAPLEEGFPLGVISEAGCPAVADPGAAVVAEAHRRGYRVVPLVGPSSLLLSLMASGFNGQRFSFVGYLPIEAGERAKALHRMEQRIYAEDETQIFIETPYRNDKVVEDCLRYCHPQTRLCIALGITTPDESIRVHSLGEWGSKRGKLSLPKIPCIFLLYR
ncbi:MAG: SAM-dependent methyltransferase [Porphyromonadaceae bacterium]|nr:SAM-dependent methyltransferase [Porphyromonadaceae bacterium]